MSTKDQSAAPSGISALVSTLIPVAIVAAVYLAIFFACRPSKKRVYRPRTFLPTLHEGERSDELPEGKFSWLKPWRSIPDEYVLNHQSLDGYLWLRFLKMMVGLTFVGCCITWPILFPVNATGGGGLTQFDLLSFSNIGDGQKNRYYAHALLAWVFFGFVMYLITKETIYVINLRRAYLLAPFNAAKISSRTVLFTDVPAELHDHEKLATLFGPALKRSWLTTDCKELRKTVDERDKVAMKLEGSEIKLIKTANNARLKFEKKNAKAVSKKKEPLALPTKDPEAASPGSEWLRPKKDRPTHKLGKIPLIGKKVDTIEWSRTELGRLIPEVEKNQLAHRKDEGKLLPSVIIEFHTQQAANRVFQRMSGRKAPYMNPRTVGSTPREIVWKNLAITKTSRLIRTILANTFITLMIIFWAIPVAVVGLISNVPYLQEKVPFLGWLSAVPDVIMGVITGLLPSIMLAVLMALVPVVCRLMAKLSGKVTLADIELRCQGYYMAFQVVQVFLVVTLASSATTLVSGIIDDPGSAPTQLAQGLPKGSNFYIDYFVLQLIGVAASTVLNIGALIVLTYVGPILDGTPRKMFNRYINLAGLGWGALYPTFGNLAIICITYSMIAPLMMGFACVGFSLLYMAYRYNMIYTLTNNVDTKGRAYAKILQQLMTGVYLGEVCLLGLVGIKVATGPIVLMAVLLALTAVYHASMRHALQPLTWYLPDDLDAQNDLEFSHADHNSYDAKKVSIPPSEADFSAPSKLKAQKAGLFQKLFDPKKSKSFQKVKSHVPDWPAPKYDEEDEAFAYFDPAVVSPAPKLWIVKDEMGMSAVEVAETSKYVSITDEMARFNEKGKIVWDEERLTDVPIYEKRIDY